MARKKKDKTKKGNKIYKFWGILLILSSIVLLGLIIYIDILPLKYLGYVAGGLFLLNLICCFFLFRKRVKKKPKKIFSVIAILFSIGMIVGSYFIYKTFGVLDDMTLDYKEYTYYLLVKNDSSYQKLEDVKDKTFGYYSDNTPQIEKALNTLEKKITMKSQAYGNSEYLGSDLLKGDKEVILVEDSQKIKLEKSISESLSGFTANTRTIYTFKVKVKVTDKVNVVDETFNIYISGMDEYGKVSEISRSDVNILMTVNPKTKQILITNIPRDYYVRLHDTTGYKDKLTHAGTYGIETSIKTIEDLMDVKIDYYIKVNFSSLENIVEALGGVEVYSEYSFQSWNGYNFKKGYNKITNGKMGLAFVRERHSFIDGDNQRGKNQQAMIEAMFRKCTSPSIIVKYNSLLNSLKNSMLTNMPTKTMMKLAKMQLKDNAKWIITSQAVTGSGSSDYTYTCPGQLLYVMVPDEESVNKAKEQITKVINDEVLESSYTAKNNGAQSVTKSTVYKASKKTTTTTKKKETVKQPVTCQAGYVKDVSGNCVKQPIVEEDKEKEQEEVEDEKIEPVIPKEDPANPPAEQEDKEKVELPDEISP